MLYRAVLTLLLPVAVTSSCIAEHSVEQETHPTIHLPTEVAVAAQTDGKYCYLACTHYLLVLNPSRPERVVEGFARLGGGLNSMVKWGSLLFLATWELRVMDVSDPSFPRDITATRIDAREIAMDGSTLYVAMSNGTLTSYDVNTLELIALLAPKVPVGKLAVVGEHLFVAAFEGLWYLRLSRKEEAGRFLTTKPCRQLLAVGMTVYALFNDGLTVVYHVGNQTSAVNISMPGVRTIALDGTTLVMGGHSMVGLDVSDPVQPKVVWNESNVSPPLPMHFAITTVGATGEHLVMGSGKTIAVLRKADRCFVRMKEPEVEGALDLPPVRCAAGDGEYLMVNTNVMVMLYHKMKLVGMVATEFLRPHDHSRKCFLEGRVAYTVDTRGLVSTVNFTTLDAPTLRTLNFSSYLFPWLAIMGGRLYLHDATYRLNDGTKEESRPIEYIVALHQFEGWTYVATRYHLKSYREWPPSAHNSAHAIVTSSFRLTRVKARGGNLAGYDGRGITLWTLSNGTITQRAAIKIAADAPYMMAFSRGSLFVGSAHMVHKIDLGDGEVTRDIAYQLWYISDLIVTDERVFVRSEEKLIQVHFGDRPTDVPFPFTPYPIPDSAPDLKAVAGWVVTLAVLVVMC